MEGFQPINHTLSQTTLTAHILQNHSPEDPATMPHPFKTLTTLSSNLCPSSTPSITLPKTDYTMFSKTTPSADHTNKINLARHAQTTKTTPFHRPHPLSLTWTFGPPPDTFAMYCMMNFAPTVFPAPLSPLTCQKKNKNILCSAIWTAVSN